MTRKDLSGWFVELGLAFEQAQACTAALEEHIRLDALSVGLRFAGPTLKPAILPALAHLPSADRHDPGGICFSLWDHASTGVYPPPPPFTPDEYHRYGHRAVYVDEDWAVMHAPVAKMLFAHDRATRHGFFWCQDVDACSVHDRAAPLQPLFGWAMAEFGWRIVHAAAVGTEAGGVLLVGNSGAGKSTTALSCLAQAGLRFLCDDRCLLRLHPYPRAFGLYSSAKLKRDMLERLPTFRSLISGWDERFNSNKGIVFLHPSYAGQMAESFPVRALLLVEAAGRDQAAIRPIAPTNVFRQLGPSTVVWMAGAEADTYRFTAEVARHVPAYRLELATEPRTNMAAIGEFLGIRP